MSKIIIVSSSFRVGSNSDILASEFERGAIDQGNEVEKIMLKEINMHFCRGCLACQKTGLCVQKDDMTEILKKINKADILVFASPVYYYSVSGQLKTFIDRMNPLFSSDYSFHKLYVILTCADSDINAMDGPMKTIQGFLDCFPKVSLSGEVLGLNENDQRAASLDLDILKKAYDLGFSIK